MGWLLTPDLTLALIICYNLAMILVYNQSAFKHGFTELDIETAMATALVDELMLGFDNKYLVIGFDRNQNFIEVIYNLVDENTANVFHAMRCRNEYREKLLKRGYYAYFN